MTTINKNYRGSALSRRQLEVLYQVSLGHTSKIIARKLNIVQGTVEGHLNAINKKMGVGKRRAAVIEAKRLGLFDGVVTKIDDPSNIRENMYKHLDCMVAHRDGSDIQYQDEYGWVDVPNPAWVLASVYRVKPKPEYVWINIHTYNKAYCHSSLKGALNGQRDIAGRVSDTLIKCIKVDITECEVVDHGS